MPTRSIIAIVDDDPSVRRALHRVVEVGGYTVRSFASAEECLDSLSRDRPVCLVVDIHLDGMSGFDFQKRVAADGASIPIIFITAHDDVATRKLIERSGAAGHLWKPVDGEALLHAIRLAAGLDHGPTSAPARIA
jgi:FixJ family two-component response regulator